MLFTFSKCPDRAARDGGARHTDHRQRLRFRHAVGRLHDRVVASVSGPPFDFSDSFYLANGINPNAIQSRVGASTSASAFVVDNSNTNPDRNDIRITETTGGVDPSGTPPYDTLTRTAHTGTFPNPAAGQS